MTPSNILQGQGKKAGEQTDNGKKGSLEQKNACLLLGSGFFSFLMLQAHI